MSSSFQEFADHLRIPFEDIASATSNFAEENLIGQGGLGKVYKGKLLRSGQLINIVARRLDRKYGQGDHEFRTEIWVLSRLKHDNLVSIVGFCDDDGEKIIINKYEVNGSLDKYLSGPTLTWMQRLRICLDAARALSYIHYHTGRSYGIIHRNIKSSKILLDAKWEVKVCGFGLSISNPANRRDRLVMSEPCGTLGYVDPVYTQTSSVTHKSDVYSFGVVLFEVLCGRKAMIRDDGGHQFLAPLAKKHYKDRKLGEIMDPNLKKQMDPQSFIIFSETAYHCLKRQRTQRPDMEIVVKRLEKALEIQGKRENPEPPKITAQGTSSNYIKGENLQNLRIPLKDIMMATKDFTKPCIGEGTYGKVYKAELYLVDSESASATEGKNKDELPKRRKTVAIKQIISRQDDQGEHGFFTEIELLSLCKHPNIVSLLGYCDEESHCILVYDLASKGSLDDHIGNIDKMTTLNWTKRIKICLGIARGLFYLHNAMKDKERIFHRDIKSANILLYDKWHPKIADFGLSKFHHASTLNASTIVGTEVYADPEYLKTHKYKNESDTYSFGVVLFEILCGKLAYDGSYYVGDDKGLPSSVRRRFKEDTLKEMVDPKLKEETDVKHFTLNRGPNQVSLDKYINIAYQCIAEARDQRPTMKRVIEELEEALYYQINNKDNLKLPLEDIKSATEDFIDKNCIERGGFGKVYKGELPHANGHKIIVAKRLDRSFGQGDPEFYSELAILFDYKDDDRIIGLVGYCDEKNEKIIVYEYASRGSLDRYLKENCLTWMKRLMICIDIARGLDFLHGTLVNQEVVLIHRDIKSSNILLNEDWKAKIADFGLSLVCPINQEMDHIIDNPQGTPGYIDPHYMKWGVLSKGSDIYSFGVVLSEILCGRLGFEYYDGQFKLLSTEIKGNIGKAWTDGMVFEGIRKQIVPESLTTFSKIAYQCLHDDRKKRPTAREVLVQLEKALEIQEEYKIWEPKLPADYKQIIQKSMSYEIYSLQKKKDLYTTFSNGILLTEGKLWFSLGNNGERNAMISAREFSYKIRRSHKWRSFPKSRFSKVAEMLDISNMKIQIKIRTQLLSLGVNYGVHLIFKFCDPRKSLAKRMYVNLKYIKENENFHAYFATWRKDEWMMIELCRFYNHKEDTNFEVLLESFSRCYCGSRAIYIEGIEFRAIDDVKHEEIEKLEELQVMQSNSSTDYKEILQRSESYDESGKENSSDNLQISPEDMKLAKQNFSDNNFQISLEDIKLATQNFSDNNLIGKISLEGFGKVYRGKVPHANGHNIIAVKRYNEVFGQGEVQFLTELEILFEHKHENVIGLVGYCYEMDEKIIAYEYASRGSLNGYLDDDCLTWKKRLEICIDVASGLAFLHGGGETQEMVIHRDIKSASILLNGEWKAKITNFGLSFICPIDWEKDFVNMNMAGTFGYLDPLYVESGIMTKESDIYSFGIVLFEILSGRLAYEKYNDGYRLLCDVAKDNMNEGRLEEMVFEGIKEQIVPESLTTYSTIAYQCLHGEREKRPTASEVLEQLKKALELQLRSSESIMTKKDQMLSAKNVLYDSFNVKLFNSKPTVQSRVEGEIELPRQQVFRIKCKIDSQILSPNTENVCYLVFKLSKKCCGLHCPVIVRDLHHWRNKETRILYFRSPSPWNLHETDWVPEERTDGWMEVTVWKFNSTYELKNDGLLVNLKLISYEGTMSGLIVRGITFRPL